MKRNTIGEEKETAPSWAELQVAKKLEQACEEIISLRAMLTAADKALAAIEKIGDDCNTERLFWRSCAERALRLWECAQSNSDETRALGRRVALMAQAYIQIAISDLDDNEETQDDLGQVQVWIEQLTDDAPPSV